MKDGLYICPNHDNCPYNIYECHHRTPHLYTGPYCNSDSIHCKRCVEIEEEFLSVDDFEI
jgi:hypothetical protein